MRSAAFLKVEHIYQDIFLVYNLQKYVHNSEMEMGMIAVASAASSVMPIEQG